MSMTHTRTEGAVGSPISNEAYNVLTALQSKLEGLEAYRKYAEGDTSGFWQELTDADLRAVERLTGELERLVGDGAFRMRRPGDTNGATRR
jgi:hypothetical protein